MGNITCKAIANFLNSPLIGHDFLISSVSTMSNPKPKSLVFSKRKILQIPTDIETLIIGPIETIIEGSQNHNISIIEVINPRLEFAKVVGHFFESPTIYEVHPTAAVSSNSLIHHKVSIGPFSVIEENVEIGEGSIIGSHVVIRKNVKIGKNCYIKSGAVIGESGFGFDFESDRTPFKIPHIGSVVIGDHVEIGANTTIARGTIENTKIHNHVKIDDLVLIAHNCEIGENTIIAGCAELSGSVSVGKNCWMGPNVSIIQKIQIGDNATIGIGSVVTKNILPNTKVMGIAAMELKNLVKFRNETNIS